MTNLNLNLNRRDKLLFIILAVLAIVFLYVKLFIFPSTDKISSINSQINNDKSQLATLDFKKTQNIIIKKNIKKLQPKYDNAAQEITVSRKDTTISTEVNALCSKHNVKLTSLAFQEGVVYSKNSTAQNITDPNKAIPDGNLMEMGTAISVTGNVPDMISFINDLEQTKRIDDINDVSITSSDNTNKASISTNYFYISGEDNESVLDSTNSGK